jgi:hypothetical protein
MQIMLRFGSALPLGFATIWQQRGKRTLSAFHQIRASPKTLFPNGRTAVRNTFGEGSNKVRAANPRTLAAAIIFGRRLVRRLLTSVSMEEKDD